MIVLIVIHLMIVLAMIGVVLLQRSEGGGLGIGSTGGFLSSRGTANVLTRTTALLALAFFLTSLGLSWVAGFDRKPSSILNTGGAPTTQQETPTGPSAPLSQPGGGGLLNQLGGGGQQQTPQQSTPPAGGPQVPQSQ
jgi:preprotein translocase subunit SecG